MPIRPSDRIVRPDDWPFQRIGDEVIVVMPRKRLMHRLEGVGARIWELLDRPATVERLLGTLLEEFDVEEDVLRRDVLSFLEDLRERELVRIE